MKRWLEYIPESLGCIPESLGYIPESLGYIPESLGYRIPESPRVHPRVARVELTRFGGLVILRDEGVVDVER